MNCRSCPHLVRHGKPSADGKAIEFSNSCGLKMRVDENGQRKMKGPTQCENYPFPTGFDYFGCQTYQTVFRSGQQRNDVVPTRDFQYSEALSGGSITDMELL